MRKMTPKSEIHKVPFKGTVLEVILHQMESDYDFEDGSYTNGENFIPVEIKSDIEISEIDADDIVRLIDPSSSLQLRDLDEYAFIDFSEVEFFKSEKVDDKIVYSFMFGYRSKPVKITY